MQVRLHNVLARGAAGVLDRDVQRKAVGCLGHFVVGPGEIGVAQAVAERIDDLGVVVVIARIALAENGVLIARLIVAIADVDTLGVDDVLVARGHIAVGDGVVAQVGGSGAARRVNRPGVHQMAAGVDRAVQSLAHGISPLLPQRADPQHGVDVIASDLGHVDGVRDVQHKHNFVEATLRHLDQVAFLLGEGEVVHGQVDALAAAAADDDDGRVVVFGHAVKFGLGVGTLRGLVGCKAAPARDAGHFLFISCACAGGVEVPQHRVDGEARVFQRLAQGGRGGGIHAARTRAAVDEVSGALAQQGHFCALGQGQGAVIVAKQDHALLLDLAAELG